MCAHVPSLVLRFIFLCFLLSFFPMVDFVVAWQKSNFPVHSFPSRSALFSFTDTHTPTQTYTQSKGEWSVLSVVSLFSFPFLFSRFACEECGYPQSKHTLNQCRLAPSSFTIHVHTQLPIDGNALDMHDIPNIHFALRHMDDKETRSEDHAML